MNFNWINCIIENKNKMKNTVQVNSAPKGSSVGNFCCYYPFSDFLHLRSHLLIAGTIENSFQLHRYFDLLQYECEQSETKIVMGLPENVKFKHDQWTFNFNLINSDFLSSPTLLNIMSIHIADLQGSKDHYTSARILLIFYR